MTADEARSQAKQILGAVETGADPIEERRAARAVRSFADAAQDFLTLHVATKRKGRTGDEYSALLEGRILPAIGAKRILDVRRSDVARLHASMSGTPYLVDKI